MKYLQNYAKIRTFAAAFDDVPTTDERGRHLKDVYLVIILNSSNNMYLDSAKKTEIFGQYGKDAQDTGSVESQVALFTYRIQHLTEHLKKNHKDFGTARALTKMVGRRRKLLKYLYNKDINRYRSLIKALATLRGFIIFNTLRRLFNRDVYILLGDILSIGEGSILLSLDDNVLQVDALDRHLRQAIELHGTSGTIADHILNIDVAEDGSLLSHRSLGGVVRIVTISQHLSHRLATIVHVEGDGIGLDVRHGDVTDEDILHDTTTSTGRLEAQAHISAQELTALHQDVTDTTTHLRAHYETTMASEDRTSVDHHILAGTSPTTTVSILTTLDADAIVARIEL